MFSSGTQKKFLSIRSSFFKTASFNVISNPITKVKFKGRKAGFIQHCSSLYSRLCCRPWCSSFLHLQRRHHTKRRGSPLLEKEGTFEGIQLASRNSLQNARFFYMPQSWDMGQIIWLPLRRKACWGFWYTEKSNGFGRVLTRELGNQRPACEPLDHRSPQSNH
jgi:hypothetical protein